MDNLKTAQLNMIESQIRSADVSDRRIIKALSDLPRDAFVPASLRSLAYMDDDIEIRRATSDGPARFLLSPRVFAKLLQAVEIRPSDLVLDVGCGTGYSTAVLSKLAESVVGLECDEDIAAQADNILQKLEIDNTAIVTGPLNLGYESEGPYDIIILNGRIPSEPSQLLNQLKDGGQLIAIVGTSELGQAVLYQRIGNDISSRTVFDAGAKPLPNFDVIPDFIF